MKRQRHTPEQIIRKLREADRLLGRRQGSPRGGQGARGLRADLPPLASPLRRDEGRRHAKRLKELERENARLKRIVADKELEADALRERAGKLLSPSRRRRGVLALRERLGLSERRACQIAGQHRSTQRHEPRTAADDRALRGRLRELSRERPRWGYRAHGALLDEGWSSTASASSGCGARKA